MMIEVSDVSLERMTTGRRLKGYVAGHEVTFSLGAGIDLAARGEPFLALGLLAAMASGQPLHFDDSAPLDPVLVASLPLIQAILVQWNPSLQKVEVHCRPAVMTVLNRGQLSSFSGGVDSCATLIDNNPSITHLLTINGFDAQSHGEEFDLLQQKVQRTADQMGKVLVVVNTNIRQVCSALSLSWNMAHGPVLCLLAASLGFQKFYIPASYTYRDLKPWGSHPVLDPLWSTTATQVVHDGAQHTRSEKIALIAEHGELLSQLQVCWASQSSNCGRCSKCARTTLVLNALGAHNAPFPPASSADLLRRVALKTDLSATFALDIVRFLESHNEPDLAHELYRRVRWFRLKQHAKRLIRDSVGADRISRWRRWRHPNEVVHRVRVLDPADSF